MSEPLPPELEAQAQELAARIKARSAGATLGMARRLVATTDETLFGDTEFALRAQALGVVANAYAEHLPPKAGYATSAIDCLDDAEVWVALCDGGAGPEDGVDENFPRVAAVILGYATVDLG